MVNKVRVKLLGVFKKAFGNGEVFIKIETKKRIKDIIWILADSSYDLGHILIDPETNSPKPNSVILLNDKEIGVLKGLETEIQDGDKIVLIPIIHGG